MVGRNELIACSIHNWYWKFAEHTFKTEILKLPDDFIEWLEQDGVFLPPNSTAFPARNLQDRIRADDDYHQDNWSSDEETTQNTPSFPDFASAIDTAIADLGGAVLPKLTWSCPKDAIWIATGNTLRCTTSDQVFLLLKSSDRVMHDISTAQDIISINTDDNTNSVDNNSIATFATTTIPPDAHVLALRKWYDLKPGREFRCYIQNNTLTAISQRDISRKYHELEQEHHDIQTRIQAFHAKHVENRFPLSQYTYDCYVPSNSNARVRLIDFNPFGGTTSPLLFNTWEEIDNISSGGGGDSSGSISLVTGNGGGDITTNNNDITANNEHEMVILPVFRILREDVALRPDTALYGVPYDFVDMSEGSALQTLLEQAGEAQSVWERMSEERENNENVNRINSFG